MSALIGVAGVEFARTPTGFIPEQDQGYLITVVQLPPGASLDRTEKVVRASHRHHSVDARRSSTSRRSSASMRRPSRSRRTRERSSPACPRSTTTRCPGVTADTVLAGSAQAPVGHQGCLRADHPAAAGAGSRQCGRLQDDARRPRGARFRSARARGERSRRGGQQGPDLRRRVHAVQRRIALGLCGYRSREGRESRSDANRRVLHAAGVSRLAVRERLQLSGPHVSGDRPGRRAVPAHARRTSRG